MRELSVDTSERCTDPDVDAHRLTTRLWQGSYPLAGGKVLADLGFDALVLCAYEMQAPLDFPEVQVICCPMDDARLSDAEAKDAHAAAAEVAALWRQGKRILMTCAAGRNRSGLVSALTLRLIRGMSGGAARMRVQTIRPRALTNPSFANYLDGLPSPRLATKRPRALITGAR